MYMYMIFTSSLLKHPMHPRNCDDYTLYNTFTCYASTPASKRNKNAKGRNSLEDHRRNAGAGVVRLYLLLLREFIESSPCVRRKQGESFSRFPSAFSHLSLWALLIRVTYYCWVSPQPVMCPRTRGMRRGKDPHSLAENETVGLVSASSRLALIIQDLTLQHHRSPRGILSQ